MEPKLMYEYEEMKVLASFLYISRTESVKFKLANCKFETTT